jgi:hypothetical protein
VAVAVKLRSLTKSTAAKAHSDKIKWSCQNLLCCQFIYLSAQHLGQTQKEVWRQVRCYSGGIVEDN